MDSLQPALDTLEEARQQIEALDVPPMLERWMRRFTEARGAHMSTRIEGNPMTEEQVREAFARPQRGADEAEIENRNYRDAVRFGRQFADDASAVIDGGFIRALHFQIVRDVDHHGTAGRYRTEQNAVRKAGEVIYLPPPPTQVSSLMNDLVAWLRESRTSLHPLVLAATAHAEFINIHPFDDGNGRTARALTSYFLARGGWRLRDLVSSEQIFGEDVEAYYATLRNLGGRYPGQQVDLTEWVRWFLRGLADAGAVAVGSARGFVMVRAGVEDALAERRLPPRLAVALGFVMLFGEVTSSQYASEGGVSRATAVADLNRLAARGQVRREGAGRSTRYVHPRAEFRPLTFGE